MWHAYSGAASAGASTASCCSKHRPRHSMQLMHMQAPMKTGTACVCTVSPASTLPACMHVHSLSAEGMGTPLTHAQLVGDSALEEHQRQEEQDEHGKAEVGEGDGGHVLAGVVLAPHSHCRQRGLDGSAH
jgi:hypothetical protein